jgi:hypothetical protein
MTMLNSIPDFTPVLDAVTIVISLVLFCQIANDISTTISIASGGNMTAQDPPPPPLAADVALSTLQCQLGCAENICVASSHILSLIRTLKLSLLLMDEDTIKAEEEIEVQQTEQSTQDALKEAMQLGQ